MSPIFTVMLVGLLILVAFIIVGIAIYFDLKRKPKKKDRYKTTYREQTEIYDMMHDKIMNRVELDEHDVELAKKHEIDLEEVLIKFVE